MKILAMGCLCIDLYPQRDELRVGGNSLNVAVQCVRSGADDVAVLGPVGEDAYADRLVDYCRDWDLDVSHVRRVPGATAYNKNYLADDGDKQEHLEEWHGGVMNGFRLTEDDWDFVAGHDVVAGLWVEANGKELVDRADDGQLVVMDFFTPAGAGEVIDVLDRVGMGFINGTAQMARDLIGATAQHDTVLVVTLGAEGSIGLHRGRRHYQPAVHVSEVVDSVGCGDAYMGGFMVSWLEHESLPLAMRKGAEAAAACAARLGPV